MRRKTAEEANKVTLFDLKILKSGIDRFSDRLTFYDSSNKICNNSKKNRIKNVIEKIF